MIAHLKSMLEKLRKRGHARSVGEDSPTDAFSASETPQSGGGQPAQIAPLIRPASGRKGISFLVDDVVPAAKPLWLSTLGEALEIRSGAAILVMPDQSLPALAAEGYLGSNSRGALDYKEYVPPIRVTHRGVSLSDPASFPKAWADKHRFVHPLIDAVHRSFRDHRPLALSPDAIWLTIVQGFAQHLQENAEAFRGRIVSHPGKKQLRVQTLSLEADKWPQLISQLTDQIRANSDPFLYENLSCEFSTTTPTIKTACQIALMEGYERYFEFEIMCVCGIPAITLEGTPEDWQRIRERIEVLATFDLGWWTARVAPILDQFISTAKGAPDLSFWQAIYKPEQLYNQKLATGWIADLFPYLVYGDSPSFMIRNSNLTEVERIDWIPQKTESNKFPGVSLESFPTGISRAPITVTYPDDSQTPIELLGGFFGVSQDREDGALAPIISWAVVKKDTRVAPADAGFEGLDASVVEKLRKQAVARRKQTTG
jgi:Domain of unknown function (DUF4419)